MQKTLVAASFAALFGMGGAALASDLYSGGSKDPVYVAPNTWAGFYIGADLGGMIDDPSMSSKFSKVIVWNHGEESGTKTKTEKGFTFGQDQGDLPIGGVHVGYNFQNGNIVYGIEGDVNFADNIDYLATIRGRLGYAMDSWLLYATGGAAFISFSNDFAVVSDKTGQRWGFSDSHQDEGYVVGGGLEKKITPNLSFGIEGLYYNFDSSHDSHLLTVKTWGCGCEDFSGSKKTFVDASKDENFYTVRARLTYHFPTAAEYIPLK